jgi:hypothetical protein
VDEGGGWSPGQSSWMGETEETDGVDEFGYCGMEVQSTTPCEHIFILCKEFETDLKSCFLSIFSCLFWCFFGVKKDRSLVFIYRTDVTILSQERQAAGGRAPDACCPDQKHECSHTACTLFLSLTQENRRTNFTIYRNKF